MSQDQFHWLVVRSNEELIKQSREDYERGVAAKPVGGVLQVVRIIQRVIDGNERGTPSLHRAPSVSGEGLHFDISATAFDTGEQAITWSTSDEGKAFLRHRQDAVLIAIRKPT